MPLGRLEGLAWILTDTSLFLKTQLRKEALLSSQIAGTGGLDVPPQRALRRFP